MHRAGGPFAFGARHVDAGHRMDRPIGRRGANVAPCSDNSAAPPANAPSWPVELGTPFGAVGDGPEAREDERGNTVG